MSLYLFLGSRCIKENGLQNSIVTLNGSQIIMPVYMLHKIIYESIPIWWHDERTHIRKMHDLH